jgi:histidine ammonia-lyase
VIATELVCACQGLEFHRPLRTTPPLEDALARVREMVPRVEEDRSLANEIGRLADAIRTGELRLAEASPGGRVRPSPRGEGLTP